ncbi:MAG: hypothetical protein SP1CHLAM54_13830 [Chlamydiia bacterium]|nr:hypothetical protein [Chlamydiia bacterium]MCH9616276.1 hypothetical protein [Chlamydiia bacterium]MCH9629738.1 hypothetical protein [Chlamydiia bacterium]
MALFSVVVGTLFHFLKSQSRLARELENAKESIVERSELYAYLVKIFTKIEGKPTLTENTLEFVFDHGLDLEKEFSGQLRGKIYEKKGSLFLTLTTLDKKLARTETLKTAIKQFEIAQPIDNAITLTIDDKTYPFFYTAKL